MSQLNEDLRQSVAILEQKLSQGTALTEVDFEILFLNAIINEETTHE